MSSNMTSDWFIRALAEGEPLLEQDTAEALAQRMQLYPKNASLYCIAVRYTDMQMLSSEPSMPVMLLNLCNQTAKALPGYLHCYLGPRLCAVLVFYGGEDRQFVSRRLFTGLSRRLPCPVKLGVGKAYTDIKKLNYSRVDAYEALEAMDSETSVSFIDDIYVSRSVTTHKLEGEKMQVIDLFRAGRFDEMMECLSNLSERIREESPIREGMPYPTSIRRTIVELLVQILHIGSDAGVDVDGLLQHQDPYNRIFTLHGTPKILDWFLEVSTKIYAGMSELSDRSQNNMLTQAKRCIDDHIHDPDLSLQLVSDKLGITPGYFSAFFIRQMDMGFTEYITGIRIELAKRLLLETGKKINAIASECGFQSSSYFIFVFRKRTGMSPGSYRKQKASRNEF